MQRYIYLYSVYIIIPNEVNKMVDKSKKKKTKAMPWMKFVFFKLASESTIDKIEEYRNEYIRYLKLVEKGEV